MHVSVMTLARENFEDLARANADILAKVEAMGGAQVLMRRQPPPHPHPPPVQAPHNLRANAR
jgi:hypothetical protein